MNRDFRDLLAEFNVQGVDFIIVGAHALAAHGHIRATQDFDVWVRPEAENAKRVYRALQEFGAPLQDLTEADLATPGIIFQIGVDPIRIDVITAIDGVEFPEAWANRMRIKFDDQPASVLSKEDLIRNKRAAGRTQDLADLERLEGRGKKS
jgi:predicted nucleotidyltransferase